MENYNMIVIEKDKKKSALLTGKTGEYEYLTGQEPLEKLSKNKQKLLKIKGKTTRKFTVFKP